MHLLALCGSLRAGSFNRALCNTLPDLVPDGVTVEQAPGFGDWPSYNADQHSEQGLPAGVTDLAARIAKADGVVIACPEYNYSIPGGFKNAIDWLSRLPEQPFKAKPVALQSAAGGILGGARMQYHLRQVMVFLDADVLNKPEIFVGQAKSKVDESGHKIADAPTREFIRAQMLAFTAKIAG